MANQIPLNILAEMEDVIKIQRANGNWNCNEYMHGMLNGMLLIQSIVEGHSDPEYFEAPKYFLDDIKVLDKLAESGVILHNETNKSS